MSRRRRVWFAVLTGAALLALGCQPLTNIGGTWGSSGQHYIKLNISGSQQARAITVTEYQVTGLSIEVRDPDNLLVDTIAWDAGEGNGTRMIPVEKTGQYFIKVTHFGEQNGETIEATESATFNISAMVITEIEIVPGKIGALTVSAGGGPTTEQINEGAFAVMKAIADASAALQGAPTPDGVSVDDSGFDYANTMGTVVLTFADYQVPDSPAVVTGVVDLYMQWHHESTPLWMETHSTGTVTLSGLPVGSCDLDVTFTVDIDDVGGTGPIWDTAGWSGTITVDGHEADLDLVMNAYLDYLTQA